MTVSQRRRLLAGLCALPLLGCLKPVGSDMPGYSPYLHGTLITSVDNDAKLAPQIDQNDGLDGATIALHTGYVDGTRVSYWDLGTVPSSGFQPIWRFARHGSNGQPNDIGHPPLIDSVPGDSGYGALRAVYHVFVTSMWKGQQITSMQALDDAIEIGLVTKPVPTGTYVDCPVALSNVVLDPGDGSDPLTPSTVYYRGKKATCFPLEDLLGLPELMIDKGKVPAPNAYLLRRQNETRVLDETLWKTDLDGNNQTTDTNTIFQVGADADSYTAIWRQINVTVPDDYEFAQAQHESDLFTRGAGGIAPIDGAVVDYTDTGTLLNRPIYGGAQ